MMYLLLAYAIAVIHALATLTIVSFPILTLRGYLKENQTIEILFLIVWLLTVLSFFISKGCFLTRWEQKLRKLAGKKYEYHGEYLLHYLNRIGIKIKDRQVFLLVILTMLLSLISWLWWLIIKKQ